MNPNAGARSDVAGTSTWPRVRRDVCGPWRWQIGYIYIYDLHLTIYVYFYTNILFLSMCSLVVVCQLCGSGFVQSLA